MTHRTTALLFSLHREGEKPKNPMVELFYGRFLAVGVLEGEVPCMPPFIQLSYNKNTREIYYTCILCVYISFESLRCCFLSGKWSYIKIWVVLSFVWAALMLFFHQERSLRTQRCSDSTRYRWTALKTSTSAWRPPWWRVRSSRCILLKTVPNLDRRWAFCLNVLVRAWHMHNRDFHWSHFENSRMQKSW